MKGTVRTLKTFRKVSNSHLYTIDYRADYKLDKLLAKGASNDQDFAKNVCKILLNVDQERNYDITKLADSFEEFIKKLCIINKEDESQVEGLVSGGMKVTDKLLEALAKIKSNQ